MRHLCQNDSSEETESWQQMFMKVEILTNFLTKKTALA